MRVCYVLFFIHYFLSLRQIDWSDCRQSCCRVRSFFRLHSFRVQWWKSCCWIFRRISWERLVSHHLRIFLFEYFLLSVASMIYLLHNLVIRCRGARWKLSLNTELSMKIIQVRNVFPKVNSVCTPPLEFGIKVNRASSILFECSRYIYQNLKYNTNIFGMKHYKYNFLISQLAGFNYYGEDMMYSGIDGRLMEVKIYQGIMYYQRLRHMTEDKYQVRLLFSYLNCIF